MIRNLDTIAEQIVLINGGGKSGTKLLFKSFDKCNNYNPLVENTILYRQGYTEQIFKPYSMEVMDYILNLFRTTTPSKMNFVDNNWKPFLFSTDDFSSRSPAFKLRENWCLKFYGVCSGEFKIYFCPDLEFYEIWINWENDAYYISEESDEHMIVGEVEVATFYQILKLYKMATKILGAEKARSYTNATIEFPDE